jgi:hypothetical protein
MKGCAWLVLVALLLGLVGVAFARASTAAASAEPIALQDKLPRCKKCGGAGRLACTEHPRSECELEDRVLFCSVIVDCAVCAGTGWTPCPECDQPAVRDALEKKKAALPALAAGLAPLDERMGRTLRKTETAHFVLVWEMDRLKVDKKALNGHELVHLYIERLETLYADYLTRMQIGDKEFVEKFHIFVWSFEKDQLDGSLRFCKQGMKGPVKLMGRNPSLSVLGNKQFYNTDEELHRSIYHMTVHLMLSAQAPVAWIGNQKAGWLDEGLAHWFEDKYWGICDNYCYQEANTVTYFKGGRYRLATRKMVVDETIPPIAEVLDQNVDTLTPPMHAAAFSYVDFLISRDGTKFNELAKKLKEKIPSRDAMKQVYGYGPMEFEAQWKAWVRATYPTR